MLQKKLFNFDAQYDPEIQSKVLKVTAVYASAYHENETSEHQLILLHSYNSVFREY